MQAHWPFHKASCQRNEFADMAEAAEPKFAAWMRRHGKLATLRDDEVCHRQADLLTKRNLYLTCREQKLSCMFGVL